MDRTVSIGINVIVIDSIVFGSFRDICGCGYADQIVNHEETNSVQLVLACVVSLVAVLALGPYD